MWGLFVLIPLIVLPYFAYTQCRIEVPSKHMAILIKKTGEDLDNGQEIAPLGEDGEYAYKGVQLEPLGEGRYFMNPYEFTWVVVPQIEIPEGKMGVRTRLYGDNLDPGDLIAWEEGQKGIVPEVLRPGRYAINAKFAGDKPRPQGDSYAEIIELREPVTVPAGFRGVVTNLSAPMPDDPNVLLVEDGRRGVQRQTLAPSTYYKNPYVERISLVDCRSQRFNLSEGGGMGFPSKDGFFVTLDGVIEFRVIEEEAAKVYVTYNDTEEKLKGGAIGKDDTIDTEIINKIILPNARSFCRLRGSNHAGRDFISGETRTQFQQDFQQSLAETCKGEGIEVIQALITKIKPPDQIAKPVRDRQIALQTKEQYAREILQQKSEQELAVEQETVKQKQELVQAQQEVVKVVTEAKREQEVAVIEANQKLAVAEFELQAATDQAAAVLARGQAEADVVRFNNEAEAAGWKKAVEAFGGDGDQYARWVLLKKIAPAFRSMMVNTADSPMMDIFTEYGTDRATPAEGAPIEETPAEDTTAPGES